MKSSKIRSSHKSNWKMIYIIHFDHIEFAPLDDKGRLCFPYRQKQHSNALKMLDLKELQESEEPKPQKNEKEIDLLTELQNISSNNYDNSLIDDNDF